MVRTQLSNEELLRQLKIACFNSEEKAEALSILNATKSTKDNLTKEEKTFQLCCRENKDYKTICPICKSTLIVRNGTTKTGRQRYMCKECHKTFGDTQGTVAFRSKLSINKWIEFLMLMVQSNSCRTIAKNLGINKATVLHNRYRVCEVLNKQVCNQDDFIGLIEGDEYYYPLSFKGVKNPMFFLRTLGRMPYTHRNYAKKIEYVEKAGFSKELLYHLDDNEKMSKWELLSFFADKDLQSQLRMSSAMNAMDVEKIIQVLRMLSDQQKKKRGISNQQVCCFSCVDLFKNQLLKTVCVGRIGPKHIEQALLSHITDDSSLITDSHRAYRTFANKNKIPLSQIPNGKHTIGGRGLGHINGYHHNLSLFMYPYHGVSSKFLDLYLAFFYWMEKNKELTYQEQVYGIISLLAMPFQRTPLAKFKDKSYSFDLKGILG